MGTKKEKDNTWWEEMICGNCLYFGPKGKKGELDKIDELKGGACKYNPPTVITKCMAGQTVVRGIPREVYYICPQPFVSRDNWCGKWKPRDGGSGKVTVKTF